MKRNFRLFTALAVFLLALSTVTVFASLENPSSPDVYVARSTGSYKTFFPDIVNVPASVYENEPNGKLVVVYQKATRMRRLHSIRLRRWRSTVSTHRIISLRKRHLRT